jgi:hypothetical protein
MNDIVRSVQQQRLTPPNKVTRARDTQETVDGDFLYLDGELTYDCIKKNDTM